MTEMSNVFAPGGWSNWQFHLTPDAEKVFKEAFAHFLGVGYTPMAFATQVVAGMNYSFLAKGKVVAPAGVEFLARIHIYVAPGQNPVITQITRIEP
jgi:hypothetical protein